jgi:hypothetical protein
MNSSRSGSTLATASTAAASHRTSEGDAVNVQAGAAAQQDRVLFVAIQRQSCFSVAGGGGRNKSPAVTRARERKGLAGPGRCGLQEQRREVVESLGLRLGRGGKRPGDHACASEEGEGVPTCDQTAADEGGVRRLIHRGRLRARG